MKISFRIKSAEFTQFCRRLTAEPDFFEYKAKYIQKDLQTERAVENLHLISRRLG
jgi:NADPH-dependent 7-cyano-7-deazaguanine reductase QueF